LTNFKLEKKEKILEKKSKNKRKILKISISGPVI